MLWETIKKILQNNKGTCIIVEDNKPSYVITSFEDYQKLSEKSSSKANEDEVISRLNSEMADLKDLQTSEKIEEVSKKLEEVKVEDIPL